MSGTVVVAGGGVAGLAVAYELRRRHNELPSGARILCLEKSDRPGGNIRTSREDGWICEWGPNGFLDNTPATLDLVRRLGIEERLLPADDSAAIRYIFRDGKLRRVPSGPLSFITTGILSAPGKLRLMGEPFSRRRPRDVEETVYEFAARRIGREAASVVVGAMVTGVYAGDVRQLCLRSTFPKMYAMETEHGGLLRAMISKMMEARKSPGGRAGGPAGPGGRLTSFRDGLQELPDAMASSLGNSFLSRCEIENVESGQERGKFLVRVRDGETLTADAVVLACPSGSAASMVAGMDRSLSEQLAGVPTAPVAVVHLGFDREMLESKPDGFGFLVPPGEDVRLLGTLWSSNIFPGRSPAGKFLMTCMLGGALDPAAINLSDDDLVDIALTGLRHTMKVDAAPSFTRIYRHPLGIPQYVVGHRERLDRIDRSLEEHPGLFIHGNSYRGISVNLCVEQAPAVAEKVIRHLGAC